MKLYQTGLYSLGFALLLGTDGNIQDNFPVCYNIGIITSVTAGLACLGVSRISALERKMEIHDLDD